jgi:hypothetical protein
MNVNRNVAFVMVPLRQATVARLISMREDDGEALNEVVDRLTLPRPVPPSVKVESAPPAHKPHEANATPFAGMYMADELGETVAAWSLGRLFADVVDLIAEIDPNAIECLALKKARTRRYVARTKWDLHPDSPHLRTIKTRTGWWVSSNVGTEDAARAD